MRILGVDCGSVKTGYGVIDSDGRDHRLVAAGVIRVKPTLSLATRVCEIARELRKLILQHAWDPLESTCRHASLSIL